MARKPTMVYLTMKGGVGKTTLAANVTRAIADSERKKILLIDADSQCNLTQLFIPADELDVASELTIYGALDGHRLFGPSDLKTQVYTNQQNGSEIDLIRGSFETFRLAVDASPLIEKRTRERFKWFIRQAELEYDLIVIDTNPSATLVTMQALAVANFLVAPISFDKFSMRGIHLITSVMSTKHDWLTNPFRVRVVPNRIKNPGNDERAKQKLIDAENKMREAFPDLARCFVPTFIRESQIISNDARRIGFVADQTGLSRVHLQNILDDFDSVASELLVTLRKAFIHESQKPTTVIDVVRDKLPSIFGGLVGRY